MDLAGPKIRLGQLHSDPLTIENGQTVNFVKGLESTGDLDLTCTYEPLLDELQPGDAIVLADELARLIVEQVESDRESPWRFG